MKRNWLVLVIILLIGFIVNSCGDDEKTPDIYCPSPNDGHLGIGENCIKNTGGCSGLYNYAKGTAFPQTIPIYRVGAEGNNGATFTSTGNAIVDAYKNGILNNSNAVTRFNNSGLTEVRIHIGGKKYTWGGSGVLSVQAGADIGWTIEDLGGSGLVTAQLQPASDIHLTKGKKQKEQLSVVADYIGNFKYATVVYIKL